MKNKWKLNNILYRSSRGSNIYANPSWWTIKRWAEFMWFTKQILFEGKSAVTIAIASELRQRERI